MKILIVITLNLLSTIRILSLVISREQNNITLDNTNITGERNHQLFYSYLFPAYNKGIVNTPLPNLPTWFFINFPLYQASNKYVQFPLTQKKKSKLWRALSDLKRIVTCHADDGRQFDGFPCDDNDCIPVNWVCDGEKDCRGGVDEEDCHDCRSDEFHCIIKGDSVCLSPRYICDGREDCNDGSDEEPENCHGVCEFQCRNGHGCISHKLVCDRNHDCLDGSDEMNCSNYPSQHSECTPEFEFECYDSFDEDEWPKCVPKAWVCDEHDDCPNGEDESPYVCYRKYLYNFQ